MFVSEIFIMKSLPQKHVHTSPTTSNTVLSIATATSILILLYLPRCLLPFFLSPVTISTLLVLAILLHFGHEPDSNTTAARQQDVAAGDEKENKAEAEVGFDDLGSSRNLIIHEDVPGWGWGWCLDEPLEVIYEEEYEGEEEEDDDGVEEILLSVSSDQESELDSLENVCYPWMENRHEDYEEEEMIEINFDEENMIEIDLTKYRDLD